MSERERATLDRRETLIISVMKLLHHLVSPYDLSESNMKHNWYSNPHYRRTVESIVDFILSQTKEKE